MFEKKSITKLQFKKSMEQGLEPEAIDLNFTNTVEPMVTKFLLKYKNELKINASNIQSEKSLKNKAYLINVEIETDYDCDLSKLEEMKTEIKNFMLFDNTIKYISVNSNSENDEYLKKVLDIKRGNGYLH